MSTSGDVLDYRRDIECAADAIFAKGHPLVRIKAYLVSDWWVRKYCLARGKHGRRWHDEYHIQDIPFSSVYMLDGYTIDQRYRVIA